MRVVDAIAEILKREGVEFLSCFPTAPMIEAAASAGIRPIICRQERVGVGIADGFSRVSNAKRIGVFAMQAGPGTENAFAGVATAEIAESSLKYQPVKATFSAPNPRDVAGAAKVLTQARNPLICAGQGVLYAEASDDLIELAELLDAPVTTTLEGKSAFPENHPLSLGTASGVGPMPAYRFLRQADVIFAVGSSLTRHNITFAGIPPGKIIIHATNDERDINKHYHADYPILGDAKLVLRQFAEVIKDSRKGKESQRSGAAAAQIKESREEWLKEWMPKLTSKEIPINPYRVMWEFMNATDPKETIVTHDSGSPRNQLVPFYRATTPRGYLGWGKSHSLGTGLGLTLGAKLAAPNKLCVNFMGDAAFGMTGLDFETAVRCGIPTLTIVLNNSSMAAETHPMAASHERFRTRDLGGNYAEMGKALGGFAERIEQPEEVAPAIQRAKRATEEGRAALLEFITSEETAYSRNRD